MSRNYTENVEKWNSISDIDWLTMFIKAWIPFNAWYKVNFSHASDRECVNQIKHVYNAVRNKGIPLLENDTPEALTFRNNIAELHKRLIGYQIINKNQRISFTRVFIEEVHRQYPYIIEETVRRLRYKLNCSSTKVIEITIYKQNQTQAFFTHNQNGGYNWSDVLACTDYRKLSSPQQVCLQGLYNGLNNKRVESLLSNDNKGILCGDIRFTDNTSDLFAGIIEVIYSLRNALFHGEVIPNKDTARVYEPAYYLLKELLPSSS